MNFNINDKVRVRLTEKGRAALIKQHDDYFEGRVPYSPPKEDADGWSEWQLWSLMQDLGHLCRLGIDPPFETIIQIGKSNPEGEK